MRSKKILVLFSTSILFCFLIFSCSSSVNFASAYNGAPIPSWFHDKASLWLSGNLSDQEFMQAIHDLLTSGSSSEQLQINQTTVSTSVNPQSGMSGMTPLDQKTISSPTISQSKDCDDMNFPKVDWSGCDKSNSYLNHGDLSRANLEGVNLSHANLENADLSWANLKNANLDYADLEGAEFIGADLTGASLVGAHGSYASFSWATVDNANFTNATLPISQFRWGTGTGAVFKDTNLNSVLFYTNNLSNADFEGADLTYAAFNVNANLTNVNFNGANLQSADLGTTDLTGAKLHCMNNPICN